MHDRGRTTVNSDGLDRSLLPVRPPVTSHKTFLAVVVIGAAATIDACAATTDRSPASQSAAVDTAAHVITADGLLQHIKDLSADSMEGRAPGTPGEDKTIAYMQSQFKALGLQPGNPDGTYLQNVDLIGYKAHPAASFAARGKTIALKTLCKLTTDPATATAIVTPTSIAH